MLACNLLNLMLIISSASTTIFCDSFYLLRRFASFGIQFASRLFRIFFLCYRYKKVAYLDTDVGQPEFTPPGFVSIHVLEEQAEGVRFMFLSIFPEFSDLRRWPKNFVGL